MNKLYLLTLLLIAGFTVKSQSLFPFVYNDTIPVLELDGDTLNQPWAGGFNNVQINQLDVNFDCLPDLVFFEVNSRSIKVYINQGETAEVKYKFEDKYREFFPQDLAHVTLFADYNHDGLQDIVTYGMHSNANANFVLLYKNVSDSTLKFELADNQLSADNVGFDWQMVGSNLRVGDFVDVNYDNKPDIIIMDQGSVTYNNNQNVSTTPDSLEFSLVETCWGKFWESGDSIRVGAQCETRSNNAGRDATGGVTFKDFNNDSLIDVVFSHNGANSLTRLTNGGGVDSAFITEIEYDFPQYSKPVNMVDMPMPYFIDLWGTGNENMLVSPYSVGEDTANLWLYNPVMVNGVMEYEFVEKNFLSKHELDFGTSAQPFFIDVNADGLKDVLVANMGYFDSIGVAPGQITPQARHISQMGLLLNVGTVGAPTFQLQQLDYLNLSNLGEKNVLPAFGDLNNDGATDLLLLSDEKVLRYYVNNAAVNTPVNWVLHTDSIMLPNIGGYEQPMLLDVNSDGLLDLLVTGTHQLDTRIKVYLNHGTLGQPLFNTLDIADWGALNLAYNNDFFRLGFSMYAFNYQSTSYLSVADRKGYLRIYEIADVQTGSLILVDSIKMGNTTFGLAIDKIDSVGGLSLLLGTYAGGLKCYQLDSTLFNESPYPVTVCDSLPGPPGSVENAVNANSSKEYFNIYPNPTNGQINIDFKAMDAQQVTLRVIDLGGKTLFTRTVLVNRNETVSIQPTQLPKGMVLVEIDTQQGKFYKRLIVL